MIPLVDPPSTTTTNGVPDTDLELEEFSVSQDVLFCHEISSLLFAMKYPAL